MNNLYDRKVWDLITILVKHRRVSNAVSLNTTNSIQHCRVPGGMKMK